MLSGVVLTQFFTKQSLAKAKIKYYHSYHDFQLTEGSIMRTPGVRVSQRKQSHANSANIMQQKPTGISGSFLSDNRPEAVAQRKLVDVIQNGTAVIQESRADVSQIL